MAVKYSFLKGSNKQVIVGTIYDVKKPTQFIFDKEDYEFINSLNILFDGNDIRCNTRIYRNTKLEVALCRVSSRTHIVKLQRRLNYSKSSIVCIKKNQFLKKSDNVGCLRITNIDGSHDCLFDLSDFNLLNKYQWYIDNKGYVRSNTNKDYPELRIHRLIMDLQDTNYNLDDPNTLLVDHLNRIKLDNRKENLRIVTAKENAQNVSKSSNNKSGRNGVYLYKNKGIEYWCAKYRNDKGKMTSKYFSCNKWGKEEAFNRAVKFRENWEIENNIISEK